MLQAGPGGPQNDPGPAPDADPSGPQLGVSLLDTWMLGFLTSTLASPPK
jgi:hypothetical protein